MARAQGYNGSGVLYDGFYVKHDSVDAPFAEDGRTRQEFADECDINNILQRYEKTGVISHFNDGQPRYLDLSDMPPDLQSSLLYVELAQESFMRLPAHVRKEFDNDPVRFAEYAADPANVDRMREWGLARPAPQEAEAEPKGAPAGGEPAATLSS